MFGGQALLALELVLGQRQLRAAQRDRFRKVSLDVVVDRAKSLVRFVKLLDTEQRPAQIVLRVRGQHT